MSYDDYHERDYHARDDYHEDTRHERRKGSGEPYDEEWLPAAALQGLEHERLVNPSESTEELATRLFRENAPVAAMSIIQLAKGALNENTRLRAAQYVTDRVLGPANNPNPGEKGNPWDDLLKDITRDNEVVR